MRAKALSREKALQTSRAGHVLWSVWGHVHANRFVVPNSTRLEVYVRPQFLKGKRVHHYEEYGHLLNGSWGPYFRRRKHAEAFAQQIREGHHPLIVMAMAERDLELDRFDEEAGICDRGLGIYQDIVDAHERDLLYAEEY